MSAAKPTPPAPDGDSLLRCYLNDHRAGATAGLSLARRCRSNNEGTELGDVLAVIVGEIEQDADLLDRFARQRNVRSNPVKQLGAIVGERVGRLKRNGRLRGYSPLSRVLELEALLAGIDAKHSLWCALAETVGTAPDGADFGALAERAEDQRRRLRPHHLAATRLAFTGAA